MIELIGWAAIVFGGGCVAFVAGFVASFARMRGDPETVAPSFFIGIVCALIWAGVALWLSPLSISVNP